MNTVIMLLQSPKENIYLFCIKPRHADKTAYVNEYLRQKQTDLHQLPCWDLKELLLTVKRFHKAQPTLLIVIIFLSSAADTKDSLHMTCKIKVYLLDYLGSIHTWTFLES